MRSGLAPAPRLRTPLLLLLPCVLGCPASGDDDSADDDDAAPIVGLPGCPPYQLAGPVGTRWEFLSRTTDGDAWIEVTAVDEGSEPELELTETVVGSHVRTTRLRCDADGVWQLRSSTDINGFITTNEYTTPGLVVPTVLELGSAWTAHFEGTSSYNGGGAQPFVEDWAYEVISEQERTVAAGTFPALEVRGDYLATPPFTETWWWAEDGLLRSNTLERSAD